MSTRCVITCKDENGSYSFYRHMDGYPDGPHGILKSLEQGFTRAWKLPRFEADEFAASLIASWKDGEGNIRLIPGSDPKKDFPGDIEYWYIISQNPDFPHSLNVTVRDPENLRLIQKHILNPPD